MGFSPGRNVGRLSIRVVPDTTRFRRELKQQLDNKLRNFEGKIRITKADVDGLSIKNDIRRQLERVGDFKINVDAKAQVSDVVKELEKRKPTIKPNLDAMAAQRLRRDVDKILRDVEPELVPNVNDRIVRAKLEGLKKQFDNISGRLEHDILSPADSERLRHRLNEIKDKIDEVAKDRTAHINVNPFTAWAAARLAWLTRPRTVDIYVKVSKASLAAAFTTLSALSGARLGGKWIDDIADLAKDLDKNLPKILGWTTGVVTLFGGLAAGIGGLVGIGQGLFAITPALLVLPGLIQNAAGSLTVLIVALRNAGDELSILKGDMNELGDLINENFWSRARQPIINLVQGLMPQLRNAFRDLSSGVGDFTGAMADSFAEAFANGRLESIFKGVADGWRILASGSDGFAGAMVSLSQIAATYTPRLAAWFVRQANTFDKWLSAISNDGRLGAWMEDAIDAMYDVWDVTRGVAGVFEGLWKAADAAGIGGLAEFADLMLTWEKVVKSPVFQKGMTGVFRGADTAMSAVGDGIKAVGRLISDLDKEFELLIGSSGTFIGGLVGSVAEALNSPIVADGIRGLSDGLLVGLERIEPSLKPIADTFGGFLGLLGDLGKTVLPAAASVLAELMPSIDGIISAVEGILPDLSSSVTDIAESLGPALARFVDTAAPALGDALVTIADILVEIAPLLSSVLDGINSVLGLDQIDFEKKREFDKSGAAPDPADFDNVIAYYDAYIKAAKEWLEKPMDQPALKMPDIDRDLSMIQSWWEGLRAEYESGGYKAASAFWSEYQLNSLTPAQRDGLIEKIESFGLDFAQINGTTGSNGGKALTENLKESVAGVGGVTRSAADAAGAGFIESLRGKGPQIDSTGNGLGINAGSGFVRGLNGLGPLAASAGTGIGTTAGGGMVSGMNSKQGDMSSAGANLATKAKTGASGVGGWFGIGTDMVAGMKAGINSRAQGVADAAALTVRQAINSAKRAADIRSPSRRTRKEVGQMWGEGLALGIEDKRRRVELAARRAMRASFVSDGLPGSNDTGGVTLGGNKTVNLHVHNASTRDLKKDALESAQLAGVLL